MRILVKWLAPALATFLVHGCVLLPPVPPKSEITPRLYSGAERTVALTVIEARTDVLSGETPPKAEGIVRAPIGPSLVATHRKYPVGDRLVDYFAGMINDGLSEAGANVVVVSMSNGASTDEAWRRLSETVADRYIVMRVNESKWDMRVGSSH